MLSPYAVMRIDCSSFNELSGTLPGEVEVFRPSASTQEHATRFKEARSSPITQSRSPTALLTFICSDVGTTGRKLASVLERAQMCSELMYEYHGRVVVSKIRPPGFQPWLYI